MVKSNDPHTSEKDQALTRLLDAVKQCQVRFGGRTELATDADSRVSCLCMAWEAALQHGMKRTNKALATLKQVTELTGLNKVTGMFSEIKNMETEPCFWQYVKEHLNKHESQRFLVLKNINTEAGRGRAWLRAAFNEQSLERYTHMLIESEELLGQFYEDWAFLHDQERNSMLPMMAAGLGSILFAINIDNPSLNSIRNPQTTVNISSAPRPILRPEQEPRPVIAGDGTPPDRRKEKRKKKRLANIVSFDEEDQDYYSSSPTSNMAIASMEASQSAYSNLVNNKPNIPNKDEREASVNDSGIMTLALDFDMDDDLELNINAQNIDDNVIEKKISSSYLRSVKSESAIFNSFSKVNVTRGSPTSLDHRSSQGSFSSADIEIGDNNPVMTPVSPHGNSVISDIIPVFATAELFTASSYDSTSSASEYTGYDMRLATAALAMAQKGMTSSPGYRTAGDGGNIQEEPKHEAMSTAELKQAVVAMMVRKDEVEEQNRSLQSMLEQEMETATSLRDEIEEIKHTQKMKQERDQVKIHSVQKENELLKHQLKKYVNAVQLLRKDGSALDASLGIHLDDCQPAIPPAKSSIDYSHEAAEYQSKLIQVAEMHGELMEFNELLHRQLNSKDMLVKQLRDELIELRGPLPVGQPGEDQITLELESLSLQSRALVNVWIPSAFLRGASSDIHHVYQVYVRIRDEEWNVYKRYSQFHDFHNHSRKMFHIIGKFNFPPKKTIGNKDSRFVEKRRRILQTYIRTVLNYILQHHEGLSENTCKETLIDVLPFFSDQPTTDKSKRKKQKTVSSTKQSVPVTQESVSSQNAQPQYTGL